MSAFLIAAATAAGASTDAMPAPPPVTTPLATSCSPKDPAEILVCGERGKADKYRINPSVLATIRAREALPPKPALTADQPPQSNGCVGTTECKGDAVPLVGMALVLLDAVEAAAKGDDWREKLRTRPDEYRLYQEAEARRREQRKVKVGLGVKP